MDTDGKNPHNLTNNPAKDVYLRWSPDGRKIAFSSERDGNPEIYVMDTDGKNLRNLTNSPTDDWCCDWFDPSFARPSSLADEFAGKLRAIWGRLKQNRE